MQITPRFGDREVVPFPEAAEQGQGRRLENFNAGLLARVYMHLLSPENFARLLERKGRRAGVANTATSG